MPVLVRLQLERDDTPVAASSRLSGTATWHRWTARDDGGHVARIYLSMWLDLHGTPATTFGGPTGAPAAPVGRVHAEHVFTRLFAPAGERRVRDLPGGAPRDEGPVRDLEAVGGAGEPLPDLPLRFGRTHTDSNQHVNSLVYLRQLTDALAGEAPAGSPRRCEIAWRKPFFCGDEAVLRRWRTAEGAWGAAWVDTAGVTRCRAALAL
ncbi:MAG: hypothetical protein R3F59_21020 [Myxococcota bacterium]